MTARKSPAETPSLGDSTIQPRKFKRQRRLSQPPFQHDVDVQSGVRMAGEIAVAGMRKRLRRSLVEWQVDNQRLSIAAMRLDEHAVVGGNLMYSSDQTAQIAPGARVQGTIAQHAPPRFGIWPAGGPLGTEADRVIGWPGKPESCTR